MSPRPPKTPTPAELSILRVLWRRGPSTVREVHAALEEERGTGYTTVLKLLQIMAEKGHVSRDDSVRPQVYQARRSRRHTQRQFVGDLVDRLFAGSPGQLAMQALAMKHASSEEIAEIRALLDEMEARQATGNGPDVEGDR